MAKVKSVVLSDAERTVLEKGARDGKTFAFRKRCSMILLKADGRTSKEVIKELGDCEMVVNNWLKRYNAPVKSFNFFLEQELTSTLLPELSARFDCQ